MRKVSFFLLLSLTISTISTAQFANPESLPATQYQQALELFELKQYGAARNQFVQIAKDCSQSQMMRQNAQYYQALAAIYLYHEDGEKEIKGFVSDYPNSAKSKTAYFVLADFYFGESDFRRAIEYFELADLPNQNQKRQVEGYYKLAYAYFARRAFDEALNNFNKIRNGNHAYAAAANYYGGFILYNNGNYELAMSYLRRAENSDSYKEVVPYLIANVLYKQKKYDELISYGDQALKLENIRNRDDLYLLVGDAYFLKNDYQTAAEYFGELTNSSNLSTEPGMLFRIGYTQYVAKQFEEAKQNFQRIADSKDSLAQLASFYLGNIYLKEDNLNAATIAFNRARKLATNKSVQEEATFKLGKVYFANENYTESIEVLTDFQNQFASSNYMAESRELISDAYLNTSNYDLAIAYIEKIQNKTPRIRAAYQKVTFLKGASLFNNAKYYEAVQAFDRSTQFPEDQSVLADAYFWKAETLSTGRRYDEAIEDYNRALQIGAISSETQLKLRYGLGYAYFNEKQYNKALSHFQRYVSQTEQASNKAFFEDALLRLADCYYATKTYKTAIATYQKAIDKKVKETDYAYFQKGVVHSIIMENNAAIAALDQVIDKYPSSRYVDDAIYQKALIFYESGDYRQANTLFSRLINDKEINALKPYAYSKRAVAYYNQGEYKRTADDYIHLLENYITHPVASEALLGLQQVLAILERSDEMDQFIDAYKKANPEGEEIATVEFESAKNSYFEQNYEKAITSLKSYLSRYDGNTYSYDAKYYLGDSYQRSGAYDLALKYFEEVIDDNRSSFVGRALQRSGDILLQQNQYEKAIKPYRRLAGIATNKRELYNGWAGIMEASFMLGRYDSVNHFAEKILDQGNVNANAENHANLYLGKSAMQKGDYEKATGYFSNAVNSAKDRNAVEAKYLIAQMQFLRKQYKRSLETLFELNKDFAMFDEWVGKSFILIADNFLAMDEYFQAKATLESVVEKSSSSIAVSEAKRKLKQIAEEENQRKIKTRQLQDSANADMILIEEIDSLLNNNIDIDDN